MRAVSALQEENKETKKQFQKQLNLNKRLVKSLIENSEAFISLSEVIEISNFDPLTSTSAIRELLKDSKDFDFFSLYPEQMHASLSYTKINGLEESR